MQRKYPKQFKIEQGNFEVDFSKLKEIADRERKSVAQIVREIIVAYVHAHDPGNPQQRLDTIMVIGHAYRAERCCVCAKPAEYNAFTKEGLNLLYCGECFEKTGRKVAVGCRKIRKGKKRVLFGDGF